MLYPSLFTITVVRYNIKQAVRLGGRHNMPSPHLDFWPFDLEVGVGVACDLGYPCAKFRLPRPFGFRVRADVRDIRKTDRRTDGRTDDGHTPVLCRNGWTYHQTFSHIGSHTSFSVPDVMDIFRRGVECRDMKKSSFLNDREWPSSVTVVSTEPFSHGTETLWCLQKEMATYRHWSVSLWRDSDDVIRCRILSSDKAEWRLIPATLCRWIRCFLADQLWFMTCVREEVT